MDRVHFRCICRDVIHSRLPQYEKTLETVKELVWTKKESLSIMRTFPSVQLWALSLPVDWLLLCQRERRRGTPGHFTEIPLLTRRNNPLEFHRFFSFGLKWLVIKLLQLPNSGGEEEKKKTVLQLQKGKTANCAPCLAAISVPSMVLRGL